MSAPVSRTRERVGGAVLALVGLALVLFEWHVAASRTSFSVIGAFLGPTALAVGAALVAMPGPKAMRQAALDAGADPDDTPALAPQWHYVIIASLALGLGNWWLLHNGLAPAPFAP